MRGIDDGEGAIQARSEKVHLLRKRCVQQRARVAKVGTRDIASSHWPRAIDAGRARDKRHFVADFSAAASRIDCKGSDQTRLQSLQQRLDGRLRGASEINFAGNVSESNLALGIDSQKLLVEYFTYKLMVLDWTNADPIYTQLERSAFLLDRAIPTGLQMVMAHCPDTWMHSYFRGSLHGGLG